MRQRFLPLQSFRASSWSWLGLVEDEADPSIHISAGVGVKPPGRQIRDHPRFKPLKLSLRSNHKAGIVPPPFLFGHDTVPGLQVSSISKAPAVRAMQTEDERIGFSRMVRQINRFHQPVWQVLEGSRLIHLRYKVTGPGSWRWA